MGRGDGQTLRGRTRGMRMGIGMGSSMCAEAIPGKRWSSGTRKWIVLRRNRWTQQWKSGGNSVNSIKPRFIYHIPGETETENASLCTATDTAILFPQPTHSLAVEQISQSNCVRKLLRNVFKVQRIIQLTKRNLPQVYSPVTWEDALKRNYDSAQTPWKATEDDTTSTINWHWSRVKMSNNNRRTKGWILLNKSRKR